ncbi:MAG TPA: hypothetical protein VFL55_19685 [Acetobacteraceae bacterium]|nr:hypothetical protein [Acetobacteraceae bacterium]
MRQPLTIAGEMSAIKAITHSIFLTPAELRKHSEWLLEHARHLRIEAEAARRRSVERRVMADNAREVAARMRAEAIAYAEQAYRRAKRY